MSISTCPKCGGHAAVRDSRQTRHECRRRYECDNGHRYTTIEIAMATTRGVNTGERLRNAARHADMMGTAAKKLREMADMLEHR